MLSFAHSPLPPLSPPSPSPLVRPEKNRKEKKGPVSCDYTQKDAIMCRRVNLLTQGTPLEDVPYLAWHGDPRDAGVLLPQRHPQTGATALCVFRIGHIAWFGGRDYPDRIAGKEHEHRHRPSTGRSRLVVVVAVPDARRCPVVQDCSHWQNPSCPSFVKGENLNAPFTKRGPRTARGDLVLNN
jgi:hypothetical protein